MRIAVFSDTHGNTARMLRAIRETKPDAVAHLGDYERDTEKIKEEFPALPLYQVRGNCDTCGTAPLQQTVSFGTVKAFLTHGHMYNVKWGDFYRLAYAAQEQEARLVLFGHTHEAYYENLGGITLLNPGTAGQGRVLTYAWVETQENGAVFCEIRNL